MDAEIDCKMQSNPSYLISRDKSSLRDGPSGYLILDKVTTDAFQVTKEAAKPIVGGLPLAIYGGRLG
jgi:hypothetical protein